MLSLHPGTWPLSVLMTGNVSRVAYHAMATGQNANISLKTRYSIKIKGGLKMVNEMEKEKSISDYNQTLIAEIVELEEDARYTKIGVLISIAVVLIFLAIAEIISSI